MLQLSGYYRTDLASNSEESENDEVLVSGHRVLPYPRSHSLLVSSKTVCKGKL